MAKVKAKAALTKDEIRLRDWLAMPDNEEVADRHVAERIAEIQAGWSENERASRTMQEPPVEAVNYWRCAYQKHAPWEAI